MERDQKLSSGFENKYNYRRGFSAMAVCYFMWGFQPIYYSLNTEIDNMLLFASRIIASSLCCMIVLKIKGLIPQYVAIIKDKKLLLRELAASIFLFCDWGIYIYAIRYGKVIECAMGYYIMPLSMFALGTLVYKEKIKLKHILVLALVVTGICFSAGSFGGFPYVSLGVACFFSVYSAIQKSLTTVPSLVSTTFQITAMIPFALIYFGFIAPGSGCYEDIVLLDVLFMLGGGMLTAAPMLFFGIGVSSLPLITCSMISYLSPTLNLVAGVIIGESFTMEKAMTFGFIWMGVIIYLVDLMLSERKARMTA